MGEFGDRIAALEVSAVSPDRGVRADVRGHDEVTVRFEAGAYRSYREDTLAHQLAQLGALLWTSHRRAYLATLSDYLGGLVDDGYESARDREYWQRLEQLRIIAVSPHREITTTTRALVSWDFDIVAGTLQALSEAEFLAELHSAVAAAIAGYRAEVTMLTAEIYDLGLPARRRTAGRVAS